MASSQTSVCSAVVLCAAVSVHCSMHIYIQCLLVYSQQAGRREVQRRDEAVKGPRGSEETWHGKIKCSVFLEDLAFFAFSPSSPLHPPACLLWVRGSAGRRHQAAPQWKKNRRVDLRHRQVFLWITYCTLPIPQCRVESVVRCQSIGHQCRSV